MYTYIYCEKLLFRAQTFIILANWGGSCSVDNFQNETDRISLSLMRVNFFVTSNCREDSFYRYYVQFNWASYRIFSHIFSFDNSKYSASQISIYKYIRDNEF